MLWSIWLEAPMAQLGLRENDLVQKSPDSDLQQKISGTLVPKENLWQKENSRCHSVQNVLLLKLDDPDLGSETSKILDF